MFKLVFCKCGVQAPHARFVNEEDGGYSRIFFSQEAILRDFANKHFWHAFRQDTVIMCGKPDDSREAHRIFTAGLENLSSDLRKTYDELKALINVPELPVTDQEAWDALPEEVKKPVRYFWNDGASAVNEKDRPGAFGTKWELASIQGTNPPDNPEAKCNILSMLYSPIDCLGTLER